MAGSSGAVRIFSQGKEIISTEQGELAVCDTCGWKTFSANYALAQTGVDIITPATGKKIRVNSVYVSTNTADVDIDINFDTSEKPILYLYTTKTLTAASHFLQIEGAVDEPVTLTCGDETFVSITYREQ